MERFLFLNSIFLNLLFFWGFFLRGFFFEPSFLKLFLFKPSFFCRGLIFLFLPIPTAFAF
ncbi:hypothetical protein CV725_06650 [Helicobacter pylori B128]|nr:hypothetical protein BXP12_03155 [Helicobacter pylori]AVG81058.1 hypothetical protein BXP17_03160 [Helicobacter pylori]QDY53206.1 hypothetical protein CV723_03165 [Helicobacter pylori]QDY56791.1 hypothetical protein CV725_06650 [Helicobacter pylori B128]